MSIVDTLQHSMLQEKYIKMPDTGKIRTYALKEQWISNPSP